MADRPPSRSGPPVPATVVEQALAAATANQTDPASATEPPPRPNNGLDALDVDEYDMPPPAYDTPSGNFLNEKGGLGTSARPTDDGRVNIRINQFSRHVSQIFTPALRQQVPSAQDSPPPPPLPPYSRDEKGSPLTPSLNVVIQVVGSREDVQPFVALGRVLTSAYGHRLRLATHPSFKDYVEENGLEFFSIGGDPSRLMASMAKNPDPIPGFRSVLNGDVTQRRRDVSEYIQGCWRSCYEAGDGMGHGTTDDGFAEPSENDTGSESSARPFVADCIIANPPSFAHIHCAEKMGVPLHIMFTMPYSPTQTFPHPLANIQSSNVDPSVSNLLSYTMIDVLSWQGLGDIINRFREKCLGLEPLSLVWAPGMLQRLQVPHTYCWSPALIPKPKDWGAHISISGFCFPEPSTYNPAPSLQRFLDAGPTPVYIGFGSIVVDDPDTMMELIFQAVKRTGQRAIISNDWTGLSANELEYPDHVFMVENVPHDWIFPHVSCVVHHGDAATTAAGIAAGRPTVVVPFFGDQPFWGATVAQSGAGPNPIPYKQLTPDSLADAIDFCLRPESLKGAKGLASKIATEHGTDTGAQLFHQYLKPDELRCTLTPSRAAAWRIKRTRVKLSAFAACTLANAGLLDFHDLKLFRAREYLTDEGPWDPISGGFVAAIGSVSGIASGVTTLPSETVKAFQLPFKSNRQQSQGLGSTAARQRETTSEGSRSVPPISPYQSQTSLDVKDSLAQAQGPTNASQTSSSASNTRSRSTSEKKQGQLDAKQDSVSRTRVRSRVEPGPGKDRDVLRETGIHTSKGLGRIARTVMQSPMDITLGLTKGFHNVPKLWGDDTVRPQEQVSDFKSGMRAVGKEFGYGMYDGFTGLVTQPWKGAQREGAGGFFKGFAKGIGGLVAKPSAAVCGIVGHTMKGVFKEVQGVLGGNVQNYIVASRAAQGYEEWLQSSDAERQEVIDQWKLMPKGPKKSYNPENKMRDIPVPQRKTDVKAKEAGQDYGSTASFADSKRPNAQTGDKDSDILTINSSRSSLNSVGMASELSLEGAEIDGTIPPSDQKPSYEEVVDGTHVFNAIRENVSQFQRQRQETADNLAAQESSRQAMAAQEAEARRHASQGSKKGKELKRVPVRSLSNQTQGANAVGRAPDIRVNGEEDEAIAPRTAKSKNTVDMEAPAVSRLSDGQPPPSYDPGHLMGTTRNDFEAQQQRQPGEKTTQERTEEDVVMEYIKKQSLLELQHQNSGIGRSTAMEDENDEDLQRALKLSMQ